jgi:two-component system chemotaxis response regulator CheY
VILLDLRMPEMHGLEFIREVRWNPRLRSVPIIVVTSESEQSEMVSAARVLNVAAVAHKPWEPQKLRALVAKVVGEKTEGRG